MNDHSTSQNIEAISKNNSKSSSLQENKGSGFICLFRSIKSNWIWKDPVKLKWWLDILLSVNHTPKKINIGNRLIDCGRGQSLNSLGTWSQLWRADRSKVRRFLELLEKDGMIQTENVYKTTRITVCNYSSYQDYRPDNDTIVKRKRHDNETEVNTNNNDNKDNQLTIGMEIPLKKNFKQFNEDDFLNEVMAFEKNYEKEMLLKFYNHWKEKNVKGKMRFQLEQTWETALRLKTWQERKKSFELKNFYNGSNSTPVIQTGREFKSDPL